MTIGPRKKPEVVGTTEHYGFREDGSSFQSRDPVENVCTRAVWRLCGEIRKRSLRPDETVLEISRETDLVRKMFDPKALAQWSKFSRYSEWRLCRVGSPALSALKYRGAGVPLFAEDEPEWVERCRLVSRIHGEPDEIEGPFDVAALIATLTGPTEMTEAEFVAERDRQLAAFRNKDPETGA